MDIASDQQADGVGRELLALASQLIGVDPTSVEYLTADARRIELSRALKAWRAKEQQRGRSLGSWNARTILQGVRKAQGRDTDDD